MSDPIEEVLRLCCVGKRYTASSLDHGGLPHRKHFKAVKRFCEGMAGYLKEGTGLFLYGDYGVGKTSIAVCVMKEAIRLGYDPFFTRARWLPEIVIRRPTTEYLWGTLEVKQILEQCDVLVIDNLNEELKGKWQSTALEDLVRDRYEEKKMTIVTSNMTPGNLKTVISPGTASLMADTLIPIHVSGPSFRAKRESP